MKREIVIDRLQKNDTLWDVVVVGGGATGLGVALDAASRGYKTLLLEQSDFSKGTSSRSTKLVHGGVRYLAQGDVSLVLEALRERGIMRSNAPHLVHDLSFIIPCYNYFDLCLYAVGLTLYDMMAGRLGLGKSLLKRRKTVLDLLPNIKQAGLKGGVLYHDGGFDDARMAVSLAQTIFDRGGLAINYMKVTGVRKENGIVSGVEAQDVINKQSYEILCRSLVNATGVFADDLLMLDNSDTQRMIRPSQGIHLVVDKRFLDTPNAIMIPKTSDKRVLFAIPWHDKCVLGTTDTLMDNVSLEPRALEKEIDFILNTAAKYMNTPPQRSDIQSIFAGLRPLAAPKGEGKSTKEISRSHKIWVSPSKMITITGGKWTTYRQMAQDTIKKVIDLRLLPKEPCQTRNLKIHGYTTNEDVEERLKVYGSDAAAIIALEKSSPALAQKIHPNHPYTYAQIQWSMENEMAITVEDVLARRLRILFTHAHAAIAMAAPTALFMAERLNKTEQWREQQVEYFTTLAQGYL